MKEKPWILWSETGVYYGEYDDRVEMSLKISLFYVFPSITTGLGPRGGQLWALGEVTCGRTGAHFRGRAGCAGGQA